MKRLCNSFGDKTSLGLNYLPQSWHKLTRACLEYLFTPLWRLSIFYCRNVVILRGYLRLLMNSTLCNIRYVFKNSTKLYITKVSGFSIVRLPACQVPDWRVWLLSRRKMKMLLVLFLSLLKLPNIIDAQWILLTYNNLLVCNRAEGKDKEA